ncbi:MAG TPA: hypothetical protein VE992_00870 [Solirubrobacteraceae bacterium]|nr:hypothetical protein [Solirubrobacteraceae bacterium]
MSNSSFAGIASRKRFALALAAGAFLYVGSPMVAVSSAAESGGAQRPVSATFGDCKNDNAGLHLGYVCPAPDPGPGQGGSGSSNS